MAAPTTDRQRERVAVVHQRREWYCRIVPLTHIEGSLDMAIDSRTLRTVDNKGRITLGAVDAGRSVQVEQTPDGYIVRYCRVVPEREAWLFENDAAFGLVQQGLAQVRAGQVRRDVDLGDLYRYADTIPDDED